MIKEITISKRRLRSIVHDSVKSAETIDLVYVNDKEEGICRQKKHDKFIYKMQEQEIDDEQILLRIKKLAIPPSWNNVWICTLPNGHLQATGYDLKNRKQYRYHISWSILRNHTKFYNLYNFGNTLPSMRKQIHADMTLPGLPLRKVLATIISLIQYTSIRIGNETYEKQYGSLGITTLKDRNVSIHGSDVRFSFKGKKGVYHDIKLRNKKLARIIAQCRDIPGKELFQYYDENGERHSVDSGKVNEYIKEISGGIHFTAKDFRTWTGTIYALKTFNKLGTCDTEVEAKKKIMQGLDIVSKHLGNTPAVCKKYYVHPLILEYYENSKLFSYCAALPYQNNDKNIENQTVEEKILLKLLEEAEPIKIFNKTN